MNKTYSLTSSATLFHADCRDALKALPDNCLDSVVTDPPYALVSIVKRFGKEGAAPAKGNDAYMRASAGFMGKTWDTGEVAFDWEFWREVLRVLKPGGHVAAFGASRGYHRMTCAIEDAGFEIRDSLMWCYGTGFPKSHDVSKDLDKTAGAERDRPRHDGMSAFGGPGRQICSWCGKSKGGAEGNCRCPKNGEPVTAAARQWEGWGTALKPAFEPIVLARKPLSEGTVAANVLRWRTGALNIDACRVPGESTKRDNHGGTGDPTQWRTGNGGDFTSGSDAGRWPANVVHDGSDEVIAAFPVTGPASGVRRAGGKRGSDHAYAQDAYSQTYERTEYRGAGDSGSAARFFYSAKASKADRAGSKHPTVKPVALMQWLARLITPPGGTVLDPFAGSGTTGAACAIEGFNCVLVEREAEYVEDIRRRFASPSIVP